MSRQDGVRVVVETRISGQYKIFLRVNGLCGIQAFVSHVLESLELEVMMRVSGLADSLSCTLLQTTTLSSQWYHVLNPNSTPFGRLHIVRPYMPLARTSAVHPRA